MENKYGDVLIYDIETQIFGKPNSSKDILKLFGCYSYRTNKYYFIRDLKQIQKIIDSYRIIVGFSSEGMKKGEGYDNPILERSGINLKYKIKVDLQNIFKQRCSQMKIKDGQLSDLLMEFSLDFITKTIHIVDDTTSKKKIDYNLFLKSSWSSEETKEIMEYSKRDIEVTRRLYEWVEEYFWGFRDFIKKEDVEKKVYLTASLAKIAYKAVCKEMNWVEKYGEEYGEDEQIKGAFVSYPAGEEFKGSIYVVDYQSLYPHLMIQGNLYGRKKEDDTTNRLTWKGTNLLKVEGEYYSDELAPVGQLIKRWFKQRVEYKKAGDSREYSLKIILNILYGILNNPGYSLVYDRVAGGDCTRLGRQCVNYARKEFRGNGYTVIANDTDSNYIFDPFNDKEKFLKIRDKIIDDIKTNLPFPQDTFKMPLDDEIKYIWFFKKRKGDIKGVDEELLDDEDMINKMKNLMKKNYCYVNIENKVVIKNLGIRKKSTSAITRKIFWEYMLPHIKEGQIKFKKTWFQNIIQELLQKDFTLACMRKDVDNFNSYKEETSLPAQIAKKYGSGIHFLIPNLRNIGVGKGKKFCTVEEFKEHNLKISDIDLENVWMELSYFTTEQITRNIFDF